MIFNKAISILLISIILVQNVECWRRFWKGRHFHGNVGEPNKESNKLFEFPDLWFEQYLDHFEPSNTQTWKQRYFVNDEHFKANGPVFLMIGGEGEASAKWMGEGTWISFAKELGALCFQLEHRFYGKSHPTDDLSTKNLLYLNSEQALADLAYFIESMNEAYKLPNTTRWIAFGGSYPGSLAAWVREKYPHLIYGAISSSGPLLAKIDFREYYQVVTDSLAAYSTDCVDDVRASIKQVEILLKHKIGQKSLTQKFKLCDPIEDSVDNNLDVSNLFEAIASNFAGVVQYNKDNSPHATVTIDQVCDIMANQSLGAPIIRLAAVNSVLLKEQKEECLDFKYDKMIDEMRNVSWSSEVASGGRQWTYQTCAEFGFYQTSDNANLLFGDRFPVDFFIKQCSDIYGTIYNDQFLSKAAYRTNTIYGGLHPSTTNVLYVHGSIDPWHALGLTKTDNPEMPTIFIHGTAHCADMYEAKSNDFTQLVEARVKILSFIRNILNKN
uniref:Putative thymus-specific serine protease n=1 Tax=Corethrella appendiculata TaxID=1370023 RepID=U5EW69_9DIPT